MKFFKRYILPILFIAFIIAVDQITKELTIKYLSDGSSFPIIKNVLELTYVQNQGMAWGLMQNKQLFFIIITPIAVVGLIYLYFAPPFTKEYTFIRIPEVMLIGGAIGNLIDRLFRCEEIGHGYVVDMIYVKAINFPVFNVADSFITVAFVILVFAVLFVYDDKEFDIIVGAKSSKKVKAAEGVEESREEVVKEGIDEIKDEALNDSVETAESDEAKESEGKAADNEENN